MTFVICLKFEFNFKFQFNLRSKWSSMFYVVITEKKKIYILLDKIPIKYR